MKLIDVIKALEDGSKSEFINLPFKLKPSQYPEKMLIEYNYEYRYNHIPLDGWEEVKPPRQWSEKELWIFKCLPDWAKWISRDRDGIPVFHELKPKYDNNGNFISEGKLECVLIGSFVYNILTITFEESPVYIGDMKGE